MSRVNVLTIGNFSYHIAKLFDNLPQYNVYKIANLKIKEKKYKQFQQYSSPELYEKNCPSLNSFFKNIKGELLVILNGEEIISASVLSILGQIKDKCIVSIVYIKPDIEMLQQVQKLNERVVRNVLQEYAISNLFNKIILIDIVKLEKTLGNVPINKIQENINNTIFWSLHSINVFNNSIPIVTNKKNNLNSNNKIQTIEIFDLITKERKSFYDFNNIEEIEYLYNMKKDRVENDKDLYQDIKEEIKNNKKENENCNIYFNVFSIDNNIEYAIILNRSNKVQQ